MLNYLQKINGDGLGYNSHVFTLQLPTLERIIRIACFLVHSSFVGLSVFGLKKQKTYIS